LTCGNSRDILLSATLSSISIMAISS
jgi:hypothetical protein